MDFIDNLDVS